MKIKKPIYFIFLLLVFIGMSGCSESEQIHQKLVVQGIGIDYEENKYTVTVQALDFKNPVDEDNPNIKTLQISGGTLMEALENISKQTSLKPVYSQNMVVVLGQEVTKIGINNFIDFFVRHCEARPKVKVCITGHKASEILNIKLKDKPIKAKDICDLIPDELGSDILHFVSDLKSEISSSYISWIEPTEQPEGKGIYLKGVAVFSDGILKDFITDKNAYGFMILKGVPNFEACTISMENLGNITCLINKISNDTKVKIENNRPCFGINLKIDVSIFAMDNKWDFYFDEENKNLISQKFAAELEKTCCDTIDTLINNHEDVFHWGKILKNSNPSYFKTVEKDWKNEIKNCNYTLTQNINIVATGKEPI